MSQKNNKRFRLLTVSRFVPEKNIFFLLDVMRLLDANKFELTLIGYGSLYGELQKYAYEFCKFNRTVVRFLEKPSQEVLLDEYRSADAFIFASKTETQGLVLAEAMANGLPVIAVDAPGSRDIVQSMVNGFLVASVDEMKTTIETLALDTILHQKLAHGAVQTAQNYRAEKCIAQLIAHYHHALKKNE